MMQLGPDDDPLRDLTGQPRHPVDHPAAERDAAVCVH